MPEFPLQSLSNGTHSKTYEHVYFEAKTLEDVLKQIRQLGQAGSLTINFVQGKPAGKAEWKMEVKK